MRTKVLFSLARIAFGIIWLIDALLKWQPLFLNEFTDQVSAMSFGQPGWIQSWIHLWVLIVSPHAHLFALFIAIVESAIAVGLICGVFTRITLGGGIILSLLIWTIPEGFGGPYGPGSYDIGTGIIYALAFSLLWIAGSWRAYSIDSLLQRKWPRFFLWRDSQPIGTQDTQKKDLIIQALLFGIVILIAILLVRALPQNSATGPGAMAPQGMMLKTYEIPAAYPTPTVDFTITQDPTDMGGWDVHITTTNFTFTPQNVNTAPVPDQGHVHLYVDATLYVVYGNWYHLDNLSSGQHTITAALAQNDHSIYTKNGAYIEKVETISQ